MSWPLPLDLVSLAEVVMRGRALAAERERVRRLNASTTPFVRQPLIEGLKAMLPVAGPFTSEQQEAWLRAAEANLALIYGGSMTTELADRPTEGGA